VLNATAAQLCTISSAEAKGRRFNPVITDENKLGWLSVSMLLGLNYGLFASSADRERRFFCPPFLGGKPL